MSFSGGGGGGSFNLAGANDVALSNPSDSQVLSYNAALDKWQNQIAGSAADLIAHENAADPHAAAKYCIMPDGGRHLWTRTTAPTAGDGAIDGDVWAGPES